VKPRRLVITVCPREPGMVVLPIARGERAARLNAAAILTHLRQIVAERGLDERVRFREGCAGGCSGQGPNVSVEILPLTKPGEREDHVAIDWKTYVYSLGSLDCLATVIDQNLGRPSRPNLGRPSRPPLGRAPQRAGSEPA
jgi:hypothetical protein